MNNLPKCPFCNSDNLTLDCGHMIICNHCNKRYSAVTKSERQYRRKFKELK